MTSVSFFNQRFDSIQALRGVAAVFVILEHIRFLNCGAFGVDIFFAISGFMIMYTTQRGRQAFFRKRLIRILPLYYLMTVGTYLMLLLFPGMFAQTDARPEYLVKSLLFIPFDIGDGVIQPLMRIGWTVNCEMFFYLIFFIAMYLNHRYRGLICSLLIGSVVVAAHILPVSCAPLSFYGNPVMLEFVWGILVFYTAKALYEHGYDKLTRPFLRIASLFTILAIFAGLLVTKPTINLLGFRRPFVWGIPGALLLLCAFVADVPLSAAGQVEISSGPKTSNASHHIPSRFGTPRRSPGTGLRGLLVFFGNMSYSIYLIHYYPVMLLDRLVFDFSAATPFTLFGVLICLVVSLLSAALSWYLIEQKLTGWLRKQLLSS